MVKEYKQGLLFEMPEEEQIKASLPNNLDISNEEHLKKFIKWQKVFSAPLFEESTEPIEVHNWDYRVSYEVDFEDFFDYWDAQEKKTELEQNEDYGGYYDKTKIKLLWNNTVIHEEEIDDLVEIDCQEDVLVYIDSFDYSGYSYSTIQKRNKYILVKQIL
jgi:hypothetical protein